MTQRICYVKRDRICSFQYSLPDLLFAGLVIAAFFGWVARWWEHKRAERRSIAQIERCGGTVDYVWEGNVQLRGPAWLRSILGDDFLTDVRFLELRPDRKTYLARVTRRHPTYRQRRATDILLARAPAGTVSLDDGLAVAVRFNGLEALSLGYTPCKDIHIARLRAMRHLRWLELWDTDITDAAVPLLQELPFLEHLEIQGTNVSEAGVRRLRLALPNCNIVSGPSER